MAGETAEGYIWSREGGLKHGGFACEGAVVPPVNVKSSKETVYDVLIVGGGYAGLVAARDLTTAGQSSCVCCTTASRINNQI